MLSEHIPGTFTQWVADNVDHNVITLDGQGTFHGMGIIAISTPQDEVPLKASSRVIPRQSKITVNSLIKDKGLPILRYFPSTIKALASISYHPIIQLQVPYTYPLEVSSDLLWHLGSISSDAEKPRPNWSGSMQHIFSGDDYFVPKSEVLLLPIVDNKPSDDDCIYSTLAYIQTQAQRLNVPTPCVTFDQPLWIKAIEIIKSKSLNIVCRLGGFHTMMSFVGSIGQMMKGSGLEEALETVYGPNAVNHMMSGKAISRALRGHFLVEAALVNKLIAAVLPAELERNDDSIESVDDDENDDTGRSNEEEKNLEGVEKISLDDVQKVRDLYQEIFTHSASVVSIVESNEFINLEQCLMKYKKLLEERSPTAKLWLQYIEYIGILKLFIRAERTGNWSLHLLAVTKMLNLFAATGQPHKLCQKC